MIDALKVLAFVLIVPVVVARILAAIAADLYQGAMR